MDIEELKDRLRQLDDALTDILQDLEEDKNED